MIILEKDTILNISDKSVQVQVYKMYKCIIPNKVKNLETKTYNSFKNNSFPPIIILDRTHLSNCYIT